MGPGPGRDVGLTLIKGGGPPVGVVHGRDADSLKLAFSQCIVNATELNDVFQQGAQGPIIKQGQWVFAFSIAPQHVPGNTQAILDHRAGVGSVNSLAIQ